MATSKAERPSESLQVLSAFCWIRYWTVRTLSRDAACISGVCPRSSRPFISSPCSNRKSMIFVTSRRLPQAECRAVFPKKFLRVTSQPASTNSWQSFRAFSCPDWATKCRGVPLSLGVGVFGSAPAFSNIRVHVTFPVWQAVSSGTRLSPVARFGSAPAANRTSRMSLRCVWVATYTGRRPIESFDSSSTRKPAWKRYWTVISVLRVFIGIMVCSTSQSKFYWSIIRSLVKPRSSDQCTNENHNQGNTYSI